MPQGLRHALVLVAALLTIVLGIRWLNGSHSATTPPTLPAPAPLLPTRAAAPNVSEPAAALLEPPAPEPPTEQLDARSASSTAAPEALEDVISRVIPAVVLVETPTSRGTGFFVAPDTLLTNVHVVGANSSVMIRRGNGATDSAQVAVTAANFDIAVLKISDPDPQQATIPIGSVSKTRVGQEVIAIGSPLGTLQNTVTRGIVSALRQSGPATLVQTDAAINPGNSGGPLLDRTGTAIGITTMGYAGRQGLNFAVAIDHARAVLDGRVAPTLAVAGSDTDFKSLSPEQPSPADQARVNGGQIFERTIVELAQRANVLDARWRNFKSGCYQGQIAGAFDREWFAFFDPRAMQGAASPGCTGSFADLQQEAQAIRDGVMAADEAARRADVYPGTRRDILRRYRLDSLIK
jgi:S1-C subfamily serine protease